MKKSPPTIPNIRKERIAIVDASAASRIGLTHYIAKLGRWEVVWASATAEEAMDKPKFFDRHRITE